MRRRVLTRSGGRVLALWGFGCCASIASSAQSPLPIPTRLPAAQAIRSAACDSVAAASTDALEPQAGVYRNRPLCELIGALAAESRHVPTDLLDYRADVESEIAFVLRTAAAQQGMLSAASTSDAGREQVMQVEQIESALRWTRNGSVDQHITGYRTRSVTASLSALTVLRRPWVVPVLYGNRLQLLLGREAVRGDPARVSAAHEKSEYGLLAIHPFADDRDLVYRFGGGDTIAVLRLGLREVTVVRISVEPRSTPRDRTLLFRGQIDVDADRHQIIRMRGQFVVEGRRRNVLLRAIAAVWETVVFAELENAEYDGHFWLPTRQRIEAQARTALAGEFRPIVRVVSRFMDYHINQPGATASADSSLALTEANAPVARVTFAPRDSVNAYTGWRSPLGTATNERTHATDFDDVAPENWRPSGAARLDWRPERVNDVFRFNRVEGAFTGASATVRFRDAVPGLSAGVNGGYAWAEETPRGALWTQFTRGLWSFSGKAERSLINTNDFRSPLDYEQSLLALLATADDYDYLDRRSITAGVTHTLRIVGAPTLHLEAGAASDRAEFTRVRYGLIHSDSNFRANRAATPGGYFHSAIGVAVHPDVSGDFLAPGIGGQLWYERGDGTLSWQRVEARLAARRSIAAFTMAGRVDAIALFTKQLLPQQLIEFGETEGLPGYAYKEFGGDRAVLGRGAIEYQLPLLRGPMQFGRGTGRFRRIVLPGISPSIAVGGQAGWSAAREESTRAALALFGTRRDSVSGALVLATRPTDGIRSTVSLTLRMFGGAFGVGIARPIDARGSQRGWSLVFGAGQAF